MDRLIVPPKPRAEDSPESESFPVWMWVAAVGGLLLAAGGAVILVRMGVHVSR
jgi:hypothetical protein